MADDEFCETVAKLLGAHLNSSLGIRSGLGACCAPTFRSGGAPAVFSEAVLGISSTHLQAGRNRIGVELGPAGAKDDLRVEARTIFGYDCRDDVFLAGRSEAAFTP